MNNINNILNTSEIIVKDHKKLIYLLNALILENRKMFETLPYQVQQQLGFDMYRIKLFKFEQVDDIFAKSMFQPLELGKHVALLVESLKNLLKSNISLQVHHKVIEEREKEALEEKIHLMKVTFSSGSSSSSGSGSPLPYKLLDPDWWLPGATVVIGLGTKSIQDQYKDHLTKLSNDVKKKAIKDVYNAIVQLLTIIYNNAAKFGVTKGTDPLNISFADIKDGISNSVSLPDSRDGLTARTVITFLFFQILHLFKVIFETLLKRKGVLLDNTIRAINNAVGLTLKSADINTLPGLLSNNTTNFNDLYNKLNAGAPEIPKTKTTAKIPAIPKINLLTDTTSVNYNGSILTGGALNHIDPYYEKYLKYKAKYNELKKQLKLN